MLIFFQTVHVHAHKEPTHQYIIREAYQLLKHHLGYDIPEFETYVIGKDGRGREGEFHGRDANPWSYETACGGAWSEDHHDPVRFMHEYPLLFKKGMFTSVNHFWDPDQSMNGFNAPFSLHIPWNPWPTGIFQTNPCALARAYLSDHDHDLMAYRKAMMYLSSSTYQPQLQETYMMLIQGNEYPGPGHFGYTLMDWYHGRFSYDNTDLEQQKISIIYSIIGRIAHLLGDMSIPAHVKCDEHGLWHDPYEDAMNYVEWEGNKDSPCVDINNNIPASTSRVEYWNHEKVFNEKGSVLLPSCTMYTENPYWTFFYTTAQLADYFASNRFDGDDDWLTVGELPSLLFKAKHDGIGPRFSTFVDGHPDLSGYPSAEEHLNAIRDLTFPYVIRATAGLLYQIALEFNLITNAETRCPQTLYLTNAFLQGPQYLFEAQDYIVVGDERMPFIIGDGRVTFKAGKHIQLQAGCYAKAGSTVKLTLGMCSSCYDDPLPTSRLTEQIPIATPVEYHIFSIEHQADIPAIPEQCCQSNGIISITLKDATGMYKKPTNQSLIYDETDIERLIESQSTGIYELTIEFENGRTEKRKIARL